MFSPATSVLCVYSEITAFDENQLLEILDLKSCCLQLYSAYFKSNFVKLCDDAEYKCTLEMWKHVFFNASGIPHYILLGPKIDVRSFYYYTMFNYNHWKDKPITLQSIDQGNKNPSYLFDTSRYMLLWENAQCSWFLRGECLMAETIHPQQHCWSDRTWHKSL